MKYVLLLFALLPLVTASHKYSSEFFIDILRKVSGLITQECRQQFDQFVINLDKKSWAQQMVDANSQIATGKVTLQFVDMGDFQRCIDVKTVSNDILGKYCLGYVTVNNQTSLQIRDYITLVTPTWSICVPDGCTTGDTNIIGNEILTKLLEDDKIRVDFSDSLCQTIEETHPELTLAAIIVIVILALVFLVVFSTTLYDFYSGNNNILIVRACSVYTNGRKIFHLSKSSPEHLPFLDGLRCISMVWVAVFHQYVLSLGGSIININSLVVWHHNFKSIFIMSGTFAVDTFLTISGTLMCYSFLKARQNRVPFNLFRYYLHRYIRLSAAFLPMVLVSATLSEYMGSGPRWPYFVQLFQKDCEQNWWTVLLHVQNYVNGANMCFVNSWYINVDMQLYVISPLVFFALWKFPKCGLTLLGACALVSMGSSFYALWKNDLYAFQFGVYNFSQLGQLLTEYYLLTHTRTTPWIVGVVIGYLIFRMKQKKSKFILNRYATFCIWSICFGTISVCILGSYYIFKYSRVDGYDKWANTFYAALARPAWSIAIACIILECTINRKGPINWILSLPILRVLNTFTYGVYLVHWMIVNTMTYNQKYPIFFGGYEMTINFWGNLCLSFGLSILIVFVAELPLITIEKHLLDKFSKQRNTIENGM